MKETWTYFISVDSFRGETRQICDLWCVKPMRTKAGERVIWSAIDHENPGHLGGYTREEIVAWFGVYPETDLELIKIEQTPTEKMLKECRVK